MDISIKAALLSGLVIPGAGHFYLKKYMMAVILAGASLVSLYFIVSMAMEKAMAISDKILSGEVPLDVVTINELVTQPLTAADAQTQSIATAVLIISWLVAIVDSYRIGYLKSKAA